MNVILKITRLAICIYPFVVTSGAISADTIPVNQNKIGTNQQISAIIRIDPSVPAAAVKKVTTITTLFGGEVPIGKSISLPPLSNDEETIILGSNSDDDIYLAGVASQYGGIPVLSAQTTALGLTRILIGPLPKNFPGSQIDGALVDTAEFSHLTDLIKLALEAATPPIEYPGVPASISKVLVEASARYPTAVLHKAAQRSGAILPRATR